MYWERRHLESHLISLGLFALKVKVVDIISKVPPHLNSL